MSKKIKWQDPDTHWIYEFETEKYETKDAKLIVHHWNGTAEERLPGAVASRIATLEAQIVNAPKWMDAPNEPGCWVWFRVNMEANEPFAQSWHIPMQCFDRGMAGIPTGGRWFGPMPFDYGDDGLSASPIPSPQDDAEVGK